MKKRPQFRILYHLYRLQQTVAITTGEARAVLVLIGLLVVGLITKDLLNKRPAYSDAYYAETDSLFKAATARLHADEADSLGVAENTTPSQDSLLAFFEPRFPVNINTADQKALEQLPRIGPKMALRIMEYRERRGGFREKADLLNVKGIGEKTYASLEDKVTVR